MSITTTWINAIDKPPPIGERVLLSDAEGLVYIGIRVDENSYYDDNTPPIIHTWAYHITGWAKLPLPPLWGRITNDLWVTLAGKEGLL